MSEEKKNTPEQEENSTPLEDVTSYAEENAAPTEENTAPTEENTVPAAEDNGSADELRREVLESLKSSDNGVSEPTWEPEQTKCRKERKVSLGTFICSYIAIVLATVMLTYTVCSAMYRIKLAKYKQDEAQNGQSSWGDNFGELDVLSTIFKAYTFIDLNDKEIKEQLLKAYVYATGDKYAAFYTYDEYADIMADMAGESQGIGVNIIESKVISGGYEYLVIKVINVMKDSPAHKAGVKVGDCIVAIGTEEENVTVSSVGYDKALSMLLGEKGTTAEFVVLRPSGEEYTTEYFSIVRDEFVQSSVMSTVVDAAVDPTGKTGIIKITGFDRTTPDQFESAVESLKASGCQKFVFDVRFNPGGALSSIVAVLSFFLDEGETIISTVDNKGNSVVTKVGVVTPDKDDKLTCPVYAEDIGKYKDLDVVVLCNESTASAAELFVANFRDHKIGKIVGTTTYGKGSVQRYLNLGYYGVAGVLKLTVQKYFPPCGEGYDGIGIAPDVTVEVSEEALKYNIYDIFGKAQDNQLVEAIKHFK